MTVEALRRRRPETLADLLSAYGREIQAVAYLIIRDRAEAEDIVIETILTAFEKGGSIRDERALRAWLLRVATNKALGGRRTSARLVRLDLVPDRAGSEDMATSSSSRIVLLDGVADLPPQMRAAVVLRYYADLSVVVRPRQPDDSGEVPVSEAPPPDARRRSPRRARSARWDETRTRRLADGRDRGRPPRSPAADGRRPTTGCLW